jgi:glycosyltransferase involved in cell wall biosynthesis
LENSALVSVVIPYFEQPEYLPVTVRSVKKQDYANIEIIVVDDGSRLAPASTVLAEADLEVSSIVVLPENQGIGAARNNGIRRSHADYIVMLDADDIIQPSFITETLAAVAGTKYGGAYTQIRHFGDYDCTLSQDFTLENLLSRQAGISALLFKRAVFDSVNGYREVVQYGGDTQFLIDAVAAGWQFHRVDKPLYWYRHHSKGHSLQSLNQPIRTLLQLNRPLYQEHLDKVIIKFEDKYLDLLQEYRTVLSAYTALRESQRSHSEETVDVDPERRQIPQSEKEYVKIVSDIKHLSELLDYSESRARTLAEQRKHLTSSTSWKLTRFLRDTKKMLRNQKRLYKRLLAPGRFQSQLPRSEMYELVATSGLFDEKYYLKQCEERGLIVDDPLGHFMECGWKQELNPNLFFDTRFYLGQLAAREESTNQNPLLHYLIEGTDMGLATSRFFDSNWYLNTYPDVHDTKLNPLAHFIQFGLFEGRLPVRKTERAFMSRLLREKDAKHLSSEFDLSGKARLTRLDSSHHRPYDMVLAVHQASRTGAPLLGLSLVKQFAGRGINCLVVLLAGGELTAEFNACSDVLNLSAVEDAAGVLDQELELMKNLGQLEPRTIAYLNSLELHSLFNTFKRHDCRIISLVHEFVSNYSRAVGENLFKQSAVTVFSSKATHQDALNSSQSVGKTVVLPQGLLDASFGSMSREKGREFLLANYGIGPSTFVVIACGTADQRKGIDIFSQVAREILLGMGEAIDMQFIWIGGGTAGQNDDATKWAKSDAQQGGLGSLVHFVGPQKDLEAFFVGADVFLLPSRQDALPCVLHQAMAAGVPVVAFQGSGGADDVLADGGGKLVSYGSASAMSAAVLDYYRDRQSGRADGSTGRMIVNSKYKMDDYVNGLLDIASQVPGVALPGKNPLRRL